MLSVWRSLSRHDTIGTRRGEAGLAPVVRPPGWREIIGEHRRHEPLDARALLLLYSSFGEHGLNRFRRGLDGDRTNGSVADHVGVVGKQFLDEAVHVMTVSEAVMNVEGRLRLSVANGHSKVYERLALVEVRRGGFGRRAIKLHHLDARGQKVIGDDLMSPVGSPLEAGG